MARHATGIVTLTTDFGESDWYVAAMRGVILTRFPQCRLVDVSHRIPPGEIFEGAYVLLGAYAFFPVGTVHMAVVDPGVGGPRRPVAVDAGAHWFVGPDNGLFGPILDREGGGVVRALRREDLYLHPVSRTFHGRDIFAPVAAFLAGGGDPESLGPEISDWVPLSIPAPEYPKGASIGRVVHVDRFGNGITNLREEAIAEQFGSARVEVFVGGRSLGPIRGTYGDVPRGHALALVGSTGFLEISVHGGSAKAEFGLISGQTRVEVRAESRTGKG